MDLKVCKEYRESKVNLAHKVSKVNVGLVDIQALRVLRALVK